MMRAAATRALVKRVGRAIGTSMDVPIGLSRLLGVVGPWHPAVVRILRRDGLSLSALVAIAARRRPDQVALVDARGSVTFAELERSVATLAAGLPSGVRRVEVRDADRRDFIVGVCAALRRGADAVLLDPAEPRGPTGPPRTDRPRPSGGRRRGQLILVTSGSTGRPKGVERGKIHAGQGVPITTLIRRLPLRSGRSMIVTPPLFHGFGLGFLALGWAFGMPVVLPGGPADAADRLRRHPGAVLVGVPPVLARIRRAGGGSPTAVVSGAGLLHPAVAAELSDGFGPVLFNLYGSSEEGWSTIATPRDLAQAPGTVGRPAAGVRIEILGDDGHPVPAGTVGRVCVGSRLRFAGYTGGGDRPRIGVLADSGDLGRLDSAGRLFVVGRSDDLVVTGGENVHPAEVENVLLGHPRVAEVSVAGAPDPEFGARLVATVVLHALAGVATDAPDLATFAKARLPRSKVPREFRFATSLPTTASGKARRS